MEYSLDDAFVATLADILKGSQVDTMAITKALQLICAATSSNCGLIYEMDSLDQFCLIEHYASSPMTFRKSFAAEEIAPQDYTFLAQKAISCIARSEQNTPLEKQLLDIYAANSLIIAPVMDENLCIYGFVTLLNTMDKGIALETNEEILSAPLSILLRYVGIRMYKRKLNQAQVSLERVLDNMGIDIYVNDFYNHDILYVNQSMAAPYGGQQQFLGQKCWKVLFPGQNGPCDFCPQKKLIDDQGEPTKVYSWDYQRAFDGSWFRVFSAAFRWVDGRLAHVVSSADITDNKRNEAMIENLANYDQLTKLPNRRMLLLECERRISKATTTEQGYLLFFDIDGFKSINDNFGHDAGDEFLIQLGAFFSSIPLLNNAIYRNGGDEFVAIISGENITKNNIESLAHFIHERFKKPWILKKGEVFSGTSIGVACYPKDGVTAEQLLQKADMAMYQAKKTGGGSLSFGS